MAEKPSCLAQAYRYLSRRDHSAHELRVKLRAKQFDKADIDKTIERLVERGYIDDIRYCLGFANARVKKMRIGPQRLRIDLMRKGFGDEIIEKALEAQYGADDGEWRVAMEAARKKARTFKRGLDKKSMRRKLYDHLVRRGFSGETARGIAFEKLEELVDRD